MANTHMPSIADTCRILRPLVLSGMTASRVVQWGLRSPASPGRPSVQVTLLRNAHGQPGGFEIGGIGTGGIARHFQQVRANRPQAMVSADPAVLLEPLQQIQTRPETVAMPTATAWFNLIMGLSAVSSSSSYNATICGQSVDSASGASSWMAAMAACNWYGPARRVAGRR